MYLCHERLELIRPNVEVSIKRFRADNGAGEYTDKKFEAYRKKHGIAFEPTMPYRASQNGVSERANRTIISRSKAMIHTAGLEKS